MFSFLDTTTVALTAFGLLDCQGFFSGTYNALAGRVRRNSTDIGEVSGRWSHVMEFKNTNVWLASVLSFFRLTSFQTGSKRVLFDAVKGGQHLSPKSVPPEGEQEPNESRRYAHVHPLPPSMSLIDSFFKGCGET
jgi:hypothetical protein